MLELFLRFSLGFVEVDEVWVMIVVFEVIVETIGIGFWVLAFLGLVSLVFWFF